LYNVAAYCTGNPLQFLHIFSFLHVSTFNLARGE
jgi:hypothetical protein